MKNLSKYSLGKPAENLVLNILKKKYEKVILCIEYDEDGNEKAQIVFVDCVSYACPDLEVYRNNSLDKRVEVKSLHDFPNNIPFKTTNDILIIPKRQFDDYRKLEWQEEIPVYIVFVIGRSKKEFYWASLQDMLQFKRKEELYNWTDGKKLTYFFRAQDFCNDINLL